MSPPSSFCFMEGKCGGGGEADIKNHANLDYLGVGQCHLVENCGSIPLIS